VLLSDGFGGYVAVGGDDQRDDALSWVGGCVVDGHDDSVGRSKNGEDPSMERLGGGDSNRISPLSIAGLLHGFAIARTLHAEEPSPRKSQVTATKSSSPPYRPKVDQPNLLTSHNGQRCCSEAFSC
jgi:hypothetical protein